MAAALGELERMANALESSREISRFTDTTMAGQELHWRFQHRRTGLTGLEILQTKSFYKMTILKTLTHFQDNR